MNQDWNAEKYTEDFAYVHNYGHDVVDLIDLAKVRTALDLGCGNGVLANLLAEKGLDVIGIDGSQEMIEMAARRYPAIKFICADAAEFTLAEPVDAVFSNAVFHWIDKDRQADMLQCVYRALNKGGQFVFEFGGSGNNRLIHAALAAAFAKAGYTYKMPFYFPTIGEYANLLEQAGFKVQFAVLFERPTVLKGDRGLFDWIQMFCQNAFAGIGEKERAVIMEQAVNALYADLDKNGVWYADYVRLRMKAVKE